MPRSEYPSVRFLLLAGHLAAVLGLRQFSDVPVQWECTAMEGHYCPISREHVDFADGAGIPCPEGGYFCPGGDQLPIRCEFAYFDGNCSETTWGAVAIFNYSNPDLRYDSRVAALMHIAIRNVTGGARDQVYLRRVEGEWGIPLPVPGFEDIEKVSPDGNNFNGTAIACIVATRDGEECLDYVQRMGTDSALAENLELAVPWGGKAFIINGPRRVAPGEKIITTTPQMNTKDGDSFRWRVSMILIVALPCSVLCCLCGLIAKLAWRRAAVTRREDRSSTFELAGVADLGRASIDTGGLPDIPRGIMINARPPAYECEPSVQRFVATVNDSQFQGTEPAEGGQLSESEAGSNSATAVASGLETSRRSFE